MQIIIPMAGQSKCFQAAGYQKPKYLIAIDGRLMIEHVINLFPGEEDFIFIVNKEILAKSDLKKILLKQKPRAKVVGIEYSGKGPVYSILQAKNQIKDNQPIIVSYCDLNLYWDYEHFKKTATQTKVDGSLICYRGFHPHLLGPNLYAAAKTDRKNFLVEIKEKFSFTPNKMDSWQSAGLHYFRSGAILKKYFQELVAKKLDHHGEYYVSLVYNLLTQAGLKTSIYPVKYFCQWGTPQDLHEYLYWSEYFLDKKIPARRG